MKLQTVTLAAKLLVLNPSDRTLILLTRYVLSLARYDLNFDVRDRARTIGSLLAGVSQALDPEKENGYEEQAGVVLRREQVRMVLFEGKQDVSEDGAKSRAYSLSHPSVTVKPTPLSFRRSQCPSRLSSQYHWP